MLGKRELQRNHRFRLPRVLLASPFSPTSLNIADAPWLVRELSDRWRAEVRARKTPTRVPSHRGGTAHDITARRHGAFTFLKSKAEIRNYF